jgi:hypothetical protein
MIRPRGEAIDSLRFPGRAGQRLNKRLPQLVKQTDTGRQAKRKGRPIGRPLLH